MRRFLGLTIVLLVVALAGVALAQVLPPGGTFTDDDGNPHEPNIEAIAAADITQGCNQANNLYCPSQNVSRAEMAAFILRGIDEDANLSAFQGYFSDVPQGQWFTPYVERLFQLNISQGYEDGTYRPGNPVNRSEMAAFILRALGQDTNLAPYRGLFADVPQSAWYALLAERLHDTGITTGCATAPLRYCPDDPVKRDQMASFLARALGLAPINPPPPETTTTTTTTTTMAQEVEVEIEDFLFQPSDITITVGTTVTWTNRDGVPHTATSNDFVWDSGNLSGGESFSFTFEEPGTYPYLCIIHPLMRGTVTVTS